MDTKRLLTLASVAGLLLSLSACEDGGTGAVDAFKEEAAVIARQHGDTNGKFVGLIASNADTTLKRLCEAVKAEDGIKVIGTNMAWEVALKQAAGDQAPSQTEIGNFSHAVSHKLKQMNSDPGRFGKAAEQSRKGKG
ncbi:hypothetical protein FGW37_05450 [Streptomyces rectiverticillatus]|uniref:hypothetical protein n=1 Tax=Streptomyces rectiverticillatus TaxID=173860 RepID=UPI0015C2F912|nr:hypothetical protein [Streptomyces rectiverticillatus]QLE71121.1 hypothetical protein FGW37_05450 [Streptomyces rectiverticillatus]